MFLNIKYKANLLREKIQILGKYVSKIPRATFYKKKVFACRFVETSGLYWDYCSFIILNSLFEE